MLLRRYRLLEVLLLLLRYLLIRLHLTEHHSSHLLWLLSRKLTLVKELLLKLRIHHLRYHLTELLRNLLLLLLHLIHEELLLSDLFRGHLHLLRHKALPSGSTRLIRHLLINLLLLLWLNLSRRNISQTLHLSGRWLSLWLSLLHRRPTLSLLLLKQLLLSSPSLV